LHFIRGCKGCNCDALGLPLAALQTSGAYSLHTSWLNDSKAFGLHHTLLELAKPLIARKPNGLYGSLGEPRSRTTIQVISFSLKMIYS
jgi:hypothetical protein